jgi:cation diffusion facilitator CzcD-associated flavoprotein CzcO
VSAPDRTAHRHEVVVVGAGFPGPAQVLELRRAGLDDVVVLEDEVTGARWDEESRTWTVATRGGDAWVCRFLVAGFGALPRPDVPDLADARLAGLDVVGRDSRTLRGTWADHGVATHLGITVSDFPNLFLLLGTDTATDTGPGRHPADFVIRCQTRYVRQAITTVRGTGMSGLDVRAEVQQRSNAAVRRRLGTRGGRTSAHRGAAGTIRPGVAVRYWLATRRFDPEDFELFGRAADAARAEPDDGGRVSRTTAADQALLHDGGDEDAVAPVEPPAREAAPPSGVG